jgi:hypothetical protein
MNLCRIWESLGALDLRCLHVWKQSLTTRCYDRELLYTIVEGIAIT